MIAAIGEIVEWFIAAFAGWRYLLSPSYRKRKHGDWRNESALYVVWDVCCGLAGIAFSFLAIYLAFEAVMN
jgi:hypothetical protein